MRSFAASLSDRLNRPRVGAVNERLDGFLAARSKQQAKHRLVGRAGGIVDQDLFLEPGQAMLDFVDETQLVGVDVLTAAGTVEVAGLERQLVHEARQEARLVDR